MRTAINPEKPESVDLGKSLGTYISGGEPAHKAFLNVLNNANGFRQDGLSLVLGMLLRRLWCAIF